MRGVLSAVVVALLAAWIGGVWWLVVAWLGAKLWLPGWAVQSLAVLAAGLGAWGFWRRAAVEPASQS